LKRAVILISAALVLFAPAIAAPQEGPTVVWGLDIETWQILNFLVLAGLIAFFAVKSAGKFFQSRTAEIRRGLEEAARLKKDAEARYAEMEQRLANLGVEVEKLRQHARQESSAEAERIRQEMERDMQRIQAQSEQEIAAVVKAARHHLREYSADLAVSLAEKRIRERLTPDAEGVLLEGMLKDLEQQSGAQAARVS
jgi:F-type H+-transporting ATPase subunit b